MQTDASFGIIPLKKKGSAWEVLLIQHHAGHWGFPKGHADDGEDAITAATRELLEETGLNIDALLTDDTFLEVYHFNRRGKPVEKTVTYFLATITGKVRIQAKEILAYKWVPFNQVKEHLSFPTAIPFFERTQALLAKL